MMAMGTSKSCATRKVAQVAQLSGIRFKTGKPLEHAAKAPKTLFESCATYATCATHPANTEAQVAQHYIPPYARAHTRTRPDLSKPVPLMPQRTFSP